MALYNYIESVSLPDMVVLDKKEVQIFSVGDNTTLVSFIEEEDVEVIKTLYSYNMVFVNNECITYE